MQGAIVRTALLWWRVSTAPLATLGVLASALVSSEQTRTTVPAGTRILIRMTDSVDSSKQKTGYRFTASLETNLMANDVVAAPRGSTVYGRLANAQSAGRMSGAAELTLELTDITVNGTAYPLVTSTYEVRGPGEGSKTARRVVGGTGLGALVGGIAGGVRARRSGRVLARPPGRQSRLRQRAGRYRCPAKLCSSSGWLSPQRFPGLVNDSLDPLRMAI